MAEKIKLDILKMLIDGGLDEDIAKKAKSIIDKDIIPKNYVPSDQYNDKVLELANIASNAKKAADDLIIANGFKQKYDDEVSAHNATKTSMQKVYDDYKANVETEKTATAKQSILLKQLSTDGANPKLINLLEKEFDLSKIELDGDKIKDWDNISKPVKEQYADIFKVEQKKGFEPGNNPPTVNSGGDDEFNFNFTPVRQVEKK